MAGRFPHRAIGGVNSVPEISANNAVIRVSDGTDDYDDGDVILVAEWDGTAGTVNAINPNWEGSW